MYRFVPVSISDCSALSSGPLCYRAALLSGRSVIGFGGELEGLKNISLFKETCVPCHQAVYECKARGGYRMEVFL